MNQSEIEKLADEMMRASLRQHGFVDWIAAVKWHLEREAEWKDQNERIAEMRIEDCESAEAANKALAEAKTALAQALVIINDLQKAQVIDRAALTATLLERDEYKKIAENCCKPAMARLVDLEKENEELKADAKNAVDDNRELHAILADLRAKLSASEKLNKFCGQYNDNEMCGMAEEIKAKHENLKLNYESLKSQLAALLEIVRRKDEALRQVVGDTRCLMPVDYPDGQGPCYACRYCLCFRAFALKPSPELEAWAEKQRAVVEAARELQITLTGVKWAEDGYADLLNAISESFSALDDAERRIKW